jgi:hypothetical protein
MVMHKGGRPWWGLGKDWMDSVIDTFLATGSARALMRVLALALTHAPLPVSLFALAIIQGRDLNHSRLNMAGL